MPLHHLISLARPWTCSCGMFVPYSHPHRPPLCVLPWEAGLTDYVTSSHGLQFLAGLQQQGASEEQEFGDRRVSQFASCLP